MPILNHVNEDELDMVDQQQSAAQTLLKVGFVFLLPSQYYNDIYMHASSR